MAHNLLTSAITIFSAICFTHGVVIPRDNHTTPDVESPQLQWGPCDPSAVQDPTLSCTFFEVPLDYHDHSVGNARLALVKTNATGERKGTVFFNPGGPGGSGLSALDSRSSYLLNATGGVYDVVSWDPRGVGSLTIPGEIFCFDSVAEYNAFFNGTIELTGIEMTGNFTDPIDLHNFRSQAPIMQSKYEQTGQKCLHGTSGKFLKYVGTAATVRDIVAMADAIDGVGAPVNYIGVSYGTILGSWLVNMFPERVGKVIIDGVIDPTILATEEIALGFTHQFTSSDDVYKGLITGCALAGPEGCSVASVAGQTPAQVNDDIQALLQAAHDATWKNSSVPITSGEIRPQIFSALYSPSAWSEAANQDYPQIAAVVKEESGQSISRRFNAIHSSPLNKRQANSTRSYTAEAIFCGDSVNLRGTTMADVFESVIATSRNVIPLLGASWPGTVYYCSFWPERAVERYQGPFDRKLANKILVVGNSYDPVTPFPGAQAIANLLGDKAALVRMNGFGHTSFAEPSTCILNISQAYMVNGTLPEGDNTICEVDADYEIFKGVNTADIIANLPGTLP